MANITVCLNNETVEFFLIAENSGNDYEALAIALAEPVDIYDAMLFIGMPLGRGMNPKKLQFWPKGERVFMTLDGRRIESFMVDSETKKTLDALGLVFIGSQLVPAESGDAPPALAAQMRSPHAIAANYNESDALFDVPYSAPQTAVYSKQTLNPELIFPKGKRIRVVIEPEYKHDKPKLTRQAVFCKTDLKLMLMKVWILIIQVSPYPPKNRVSPDHRSGSNRHIQSW